MISKTAFFIVLVMVAMEAFIVGFAEGRKFRNEKDTHPARRAPSPQRVEGEEEEEKTTTAERSEQNVRAKRTKNHNDEDRMGF